MINRDQILGLAVEANANNQCDLSDHLLEVVGRFGDSGEPNDYDAEMHVDAAMARGFSIAARNERKSSDCLVALAAGMVS